MRISKKGLIFILVLLLVTSSTIGYAINKKFEELDQKIKNLEQQLSTAKDQLVVANEQISLLKEEKDDQKAKYENQISSQLSYIEDLEDRIERMTGQPVMPKDKTVYLTFDDGPSVNTNKVLDILNDYKIKGTFFVVGRNNQQSLATYKRIVDEGHAIGNHTYSHIYKNIYSDVNIFMSDIYKLNNLIYETTGLETKLFRFPGGSSTQHLAGGKYKPYINRLLNEGFQYFDWNIDSGDALAQPLTSGEIIQRTIEGVRKQKHAVVLMHEKKTTLDALPVIIEYLRDLGYKFEKISVDSFYGHHRE